MVKSICNGLDISLDMKFLTRFPRWHLEISGTLKAEPKWQVLGPGAVPVEFSSQKTVALQHSISLPLCPP